MTPPPDTYKPVPTRRALFAAILVDPEEDTPRLALADYLDENGDTADADLAELTRVQIVAATYPELGIPCNSPIDSPIPCDSPMCIHRWCAALKRERELLAAHPEWQAELRMPCPRCDGTGRRKTYESQLDGICPACVGSGDLLKQRRRWTQEDPDYGEQLREDTTARPVTLRRGLTLRVECRMDEVVRRCTVCDGDGLCRTGGVECGETVESIRVTRNQTECPVCDGGWQLTPWAAAFYQACLGMERVPELAVTDCTPYIADGVYYWSAQGWENRGSDVLPQPIYDLLPDLGLSSDGRSMKGFRTLEAARDALLVALNRWVWEQMNKPLGVS